jgi:hypothetical protein
MEGRGTGASTVADCHRPCGLPGAGQCRAHASILISSRQAKWHVATVVPAAGPDTCGYPCSSCPGEGAACSAYQPTSSCSCPSPYLLRGVAACCSHQELDQPWQVLNVHCRELGQQRAHHLILRKRGWGRGGEGGEQAGCEQQQQWQSRQSKPDEDSGSNRSVDSIAQRCGCCTGLFVVTHTGARCPPSPPPARCPEAPSSAALTCTAGPRTMLPRQSTTGAMKPTSDCSRPCSCSSTAGWSCGCVTSGRMLISCRCVLGGHTGSTSSMVCVRAGASATTSNLQGHVYAHVSCQEVQATCVMCM